MRTTSLLLILAAAAMGCAAESNTDYDNDGVTADVDCNDLDESQGEARVWYSDADGDGWGGEGDGATTQESCERPTDGLWALRTGDCDDADPGISPNAEEACNGVDDDCDTFTDENTDKGLWYADTDGDGFGDPSTFTERCDGTGGYVSNGLDCDDTNAASKPGADEICDGLDNDCDARVDESDAVDAKGWYLDSDADGFGQTTTEVIACDPPSENWSDAGADCNDDDLTINPGAPEQCDGFDNNCDGRIDDEDAVDALDWFADDDGDGFGDDDASVRACRQPEGFIGEGGDCDDRNRFLNPATLWYLDDDGDNYGDPGMSTASCTDPSSTGSTYVDNNQDCDDADLNVNPLGTEECDGIDNDCDGTADGGDAIDAETYFMDFDGDGFGDPGRTGRACSRPDGFTTDDTDCNDDNEAVYPGADEFCDGIDNDCDALVDFADPDVQVLTWYLDTDGDGYGQTSVTKDECEKPTGYVIKDNDCDDADPDVNPGAEEVCDAGLDNDCNGLADKADPNWTGKDGTWYRDTDGDSYGDESLTVITCSEPSGYVRNDDDCDDADATKWNTCWAGQRDFTACSATGHNGPTQSACNTSYSGTTLDGEVTVSAGIQEWEVPQDGTYRIEAWGGQGAAAQSGRAGGKGARVRGDFSLSKGDVLFIAVGQEGIAISGTNGGGGGGSWIVDDLDDPLLVAGGGGGTRGGATMDGCDGRTSEYAGTGTNSSSHSCSAKTSGLAGGGAFATISYGSGGGGLKSDGGSDPNPTVCRTGATCGGSGWNNGVVGGYASSSSADGGFGGGGAGNGQNGGGGGGGYSGGDGGWISGGGGSFNDGADTSSTAGAQTGPGKISIDWLGK